jgi:hypothetical protein
MTREISVSLAKYIHTFFYASFGCPITVGFETAQHLIFAFGFHEKTIFESTISEDQDPITTIPSISSTPADRAQDFLYRFS